jgi:hypothetical protein
MKTSRNLVLAIVFSMLFLILIPFIRINSARSPYCTLHLSECPIIESFAPLPASPIYYSVIAYYLGFGAYYGVHYGYGFLLVGQSVRIA